MLPSHENLTAHASAVSVYHVYDQSCGSFVNGWTQTPEARDAIVEVEDYSAGMTSTLPVKSTLGAPASSRSFHR